MFFGRELAATIRQARVVPLYPGPAGRRWVDGASRFYLEYGDGDAAADAAGSIAPAARAESSGDGEGVAEVESDAAAEHEDDARVAAGGDSSPVTEVTLACGRDGFPRRNAKNIEAQKAALLAFERQHRARAPAASESTHSGGPPPSSAAVRQAEEAPRPKCDCSSQASSSSVQPSCPKCKPTQAWPAKRSKSSR